MPYYAFRWVGIIDEWDRFLIRSERNLTTEEMTQLLVKHAPGALAELERRYANLYERYQISNLSLQEYLTSMFRNIDLEEFLDALAEELANKEPGIERVRVTRTFRFKQDQELSMTGPKFDDWVGHLEQAARSWVGEKYPEALKEAEHAELAG